MGSSLTLYHYLDHERDLLHSYRSTLQSVEDATRKAMMEEYGKVEF